MHLTQLRKSFGEFDRVILPLRRLVTNTAAERGASGRNARRIGSVCRLSRDSCRILMKTVHGSGMQSEVVLTLPISGYWRRHRPKRPKQAAAAGRRPVPRTDTDLIWTKIALLGSVRLSPPGPRCITGVAWEREPNTMVIKRMRWKVKCCVTGFCRPRSLFFLSNMSGTS